MGAKYTHRLSRNAMSCLFETILGGADQDRLAVAAHEALDEVERIEYCLSRFIDTSDIARINAHAASGPVRVGPETIELLQLARRICRMTDDAFDVTAGPVTRLWREWRAGSHRPDRRRIRQALAHVGMHHVHVDPDERTVWFDHAGTEVDLGAIGKGYAVDAAMDVVRRYGITDAAVCGADSSMRVIGTAPGSPAGREGWEFRPRNPLDTSRNVSAFRLRSGAIGISAQNEQYYLHRGRLLGHIVDPRTGWPVAPDFATLVVAPTATEADALATAFFVLGPERTSDLAKTHRGVSVAFIECRTTPEEAKLTWVVRSEDVPAETQAEAGSRETNGAANGDESSLGTGLNHEWRSSE